MCVLYVHDNSLARKVALGASHRRSIFEIVFTGTFSQKRHLKKERSTIFVYKASYKKNLPKTCVINKKLALIHISTFLKSGKIGR